jgi:hypothetical protein
VALEFVSGAGGRNEQSPKIFKIKVPIFRKKNANNFHYDKRSKLDTIIVLLYINILIIVDKNFTYYFIILNLLYKFLFWSKTAKPILDYTATHIFI